MWLAKEQNFKMGKQSDASVVKLCWLFVREDEGSREKSL